MISALRQYVPSAPNGSEVNSRGPLSRLNQVSGVLTQDLPGFACNKAFECQHANSIAQNLKPTPARTLVISNTRIPASGKVGDVGPVAAELLYVDDAELLTLLGGLRCRVSEVKRLSEAIAMVDDEKCRAGRGVYIRGKMATPMVS